MTWDDITIGKFQELATFNEESESYDETDRIIGIMSILFDKDDEYFLNLPLPEYIEHSREISFLSSNPEPIFKDKIELQGKIYDLQPNVEKFKAGQFIDLTTYLSSSPINYGGLMASVYIPRDEKGKKRGYQEGYDALEVTEVFKKHLPITYSMGVSVFFWNLMESLSKSTLTFLIKKMKIQLRLETSLKRKKWIRKSIQVMESSTNVMRGLYLQKKYRS